MERINDTINHQMSLSQDLVDANISNVLVIYTGGTIGMRQCPNHGYVPVPGYLSKILVRMARFHDPTGCAYSDVEACETAPNTDSTVFIPTHYHPHSFEARHHADFHPRPVEIIRGIACTRTLQRSLITPTSLYNKKTKYSILEYNPLLDSSNMTMDDWCKIATDVEVNYHLFDAFIILHGTDTMAYTSSALSFMFENLGKPVILTGSQVPFSEIRNDAVENLLGALTIASHFCIPEVSLYFASKLYRGNRVDAYDFAAFESPNLKPLVTLGVNIDVAWDIILEKPIGPFSVQKRMDPNVACIRLFPGITDATIAMFLAPPIRGVILETFGSGNAPNNRPALLQTFKTASENGIVIVNCTQRGLVTDIYATGRALSKVGVIPGADMTLECALAKLSYLLAGNHDAGGLIRVDLRGELSSPVKPTVQLDSTDTMLAFLSGLKGEDKQRVMGVVMPGLWKDVIERGDLHGLRRVLRDYPHSLENSEMLVGIAIASTHVKRNDIIKELLITGGILGLSYKAMPEVALWTREFSHLFLEDDLS